MQHAGQREAAGIGVGAHFAALLQPAPHEPAALQGGNVRVVGKSEHKWLGSSVPWKANPKCGCSEEQGPTVRRACSQRNNKSGPALLNGEPSSDGPIDRCKG